MHSAAAVDAAIGDALGKELEELFREHHELIYRTAYSVTGSRQDAEDVLQTLFLRLLRRGLPPEFHGNPKGYVYRAAVNLALNTVRTRRRRNVSGDVDQLPAPVVEVSDAGADDERRQRLLQAIAQLRPRAVEILILHYEHEYSDAAIARLLGTSRVTIAVTLHRTRARLKKLLLHTIPGGHR